MAEPKSEAAWETNIRRVMTELGVSREAAMLLLAVESGDALVNDCISLGVDEPLDPELEADLARWRAARLPKQTA